MIMSPSHRSDIEKNISDNEYFDFASSKVVNESAVAILSMSEKVKLQTFNYFNDTNGGGN